jgi:hypothetical protein
LEYRKIRVTAIKIKKTTVYAKKVNRQLVAAAAEQNTINQNARRDGVVNQKAIKRLSFPPNLLVQTKDQMMIRGKNRLHDIAGLAQKWLSSELQDGAIFFY